MKKLFLLLSVISLSFTFSIAQEVKRPRELWVFRSVLDKRPKIVTIGLHDNLWVAYDPINCGIYKVWKEGVKFDGAVYTTKHGPQPTTVGKLYFEGIIDDAIWSVRKSGVSIPSKTIFKGYNWKNNKVTLKYEIQFDNGKKINVEETPEYTLRTKDNSIGLERKFKTSNVPEGYSVDVDLRLNSMTNKKDLYTDCDFKIKERKEDFHSWGKTFCLRGHLNLKSNQTTTLVTYFPTKAVQ